MAIDGHILLHEPSGELRTPGVDYGQTEKKPLRLVKRTLRALVFLAPGHSAWGGVGLDREYVPARFHVFEIKTEAPAMDRLPGRGWNRHGWIEFKVRAVADFPARGVER